MAEVKAVRFGALPEGFRNWGIAMQLIKQGRSVRHPRCRRHHGVAACLAVVSAPALVLPASSAIAAEADPTTVSASYTISFAGVDIGKFQFHSKVSGNRFELDSASRVKLLFGAFKWSSNSKTVGRLGRSASPESFDFEYHIKKKRKHTRMKLAGGRVVGIENTPRVNYTSEHVPLLAKHLVGVVDPMTAIMRMTRVAKGNPCAQTHEVFDGKMRFRLSLSDKGRRRISDPKPSGQPLFGYVCQVKFTPIAGHKKSQSINYIAGNNGIEVVLRPVPSAKTMVPYRINIPTIVGSVAVSLRTVNIASGRRLRIALRQ